VRFLCTFAGGAGHLHPTLPVARALRQRGHDVAYACQADLVPDVERAGFPAYDTGGATVLASAVRRPPLRVPLRQRFDRARLGALSAAAPGR